MKRHILTILFSLLIVSGSIGQNSAVEEMQSRIDNAKSLEEKLQAYWELSRQLTFYDHEKAMAASKKHFRLAEENGVKNHMVYAKGSQAMIHMNSKNAELAKIELDSAAAIADGDTNAGLDILFNYYGILYTITQEYEKSLDYYMKTKAIYEATNEDDYPMAILLSGIGTTHIELGNYAQAQIHYEQALDLLVEEDHYELGGMSNNLAEAMKLSGAPFDTVMAVLDYALEESYLAFDTIGVFLVYTNMLDLCIENERVEKAKHYLAEAGAIRDRIPEDPDLVYHYELTKANFLFLNGEYQECVMQAKSVYAYTLTDSLATKDFLRSLDLIRKSYRAMSNEEQYGKYTEMYIHAKDSLDQVELATAVFDLEQKYEVARREKQLVEQQCAIQDQEAQIAIIEGEKQRQVGYIIGLAVLLGLIVSVSALAVNRQRLKRQKIELERNLTESELANTQLEKQKLMEELEHQQRELAAYTLSLVRKNELLHQLQEKVSKMDEVNQEIKEVSSLIRTNIAQDSEWDEFNLRFKRVHPDFYSNLQGKYPELTQNEVRICALIRLNLNSREMAGLLGINVRSIDQNKYRIKKKLQLEAEQNLVEVIQSL